eukprot:jgi/Chrpa1/16103/Chrysochromulina_OHIO_Genome00007369-RA
MLFGHMQPGKCRVTFVGDSTVHDVWAAAVADAMHELRLPLASCDFNGVHGDWLREEGAFCQANKSVDELRRLPKESLLTCNATFAETAVVTGGTCTSVVLDYWQSAMLVVPRYFRRVEPPAPLLLMQASSFVFLGGGVHANSERDLERIANTTISPFLLTALRQADRQVADRQVADRQVIRRSASAMTSASWKKSTVGRAPDTAPGTARAAGGFASPGGKVGGKERQLARLPDMAGLARLLWLETLPQHFPGEDGSGTFRWSAMAASPRLQPAPPWVRLRLFHLFLDRHDMHGSSTDPKTRRIPGVGVDCTHFCFSPWLYAPVWDAAVNAALGLAAVPLP